MIALDFGIPCPHEVADPTIWNNSLPFEERAANHSRMPRLPDYHPLTKEEVATLLDDTVEAERRCGDIDDIDAIDTIYATQVRLTRGIVGMTCPRPTYGNVYDKLRKVESLYREVLQNGSNAAIVDQLYHIMTG